LRVDLLPEMLMGATMEETMETFGEEARKAANGGTGVAALLGELPQQGEQLTASARRRQKRLENKRKRLLQEDVEAAEAAAEAPEAEEAVSTGVSSYLLPAGVSTTALQGQKFEGLARRG
jgi:putative NADH-flavin reductase